MRNIQKKNKRDTVLIPIVYEIILFYKCFFWGETHFLCVIWNGGIRFNDEIEIFFCESFFFFFYKRGVNKKTVGKKKREIQA
jgi:hypothetical protein